MLDFGNAMPDFGSAYGMSMCMYTIYKSPDLATSRPGPSRVGSVLDSFLADRSLAASESSLPSASRLADAAAGDQRRRRMCDVYLDLCLCLATLLYRCVCVARRYTGGVYVSPVRVCTLYIVYHSMI